MQKILFDTSIQSLDDIKQFLIEELKINETSNIIVEGADLVGKSSVVAIINEIIDINNHSKNSYYNENDFIFWLGRYSKLGLQERGHLSTIIYEPIMCDNSKLDFVEHTTLNQVINALRYIEIYINCSIEDLITRYDEHGDEYVDLSQLLDVYEQYQDYYMLLGLMSREDHDGVVDKINNIRKERNLSSVLLELRERDREQMEQEMTSA